MGLEGVWRKFPAGHLKASEDEILGPPYWPAPHDLGTSLVKHGKF